MDYTVTETDLAGSLKRLKLQMPENLSFLPENIEEADKIGDFIYPDTLTELKKTLRLQHVPVPTLEDTKPQLLGRKSADLFLPSLFIGVGTILSNPNVVSVALNIISSYVYDFFKGNPGRKTVAIDIFVEQQGDKTVKKITYKGGPEGIKDLANVIKQLEK